MPQEENKVPKMLADGLSVAFGKRQALHQVTLPVHNQTILSVLGPSGSGKTVLLKALNRLNELEGGATSGKVLLEGTDIQGLAPELLRRRVGMVFQQPQPFRMNIYNNVSYGPRLEGTHSRAQLDETVESALRVVGLWEDLRGKLRRSPASLTAGQLHRLCIARTLATQPEVLLLDEPTAALGPGSGMLIEELMLELADAGMTIVTATLNIQQAARISDYCAFLLNGSLVEYSTADTFFSHPQDVQTDSYINGRLL